MFKKVDDSAISLAIILLQSKKKNYIILAKEVINNKNKIYFLTHSNYYCPYFFEKNPSKICCVLILYILSSQAHPLI